MWKTHSSVKYFLSGGLFFLYNFVSRDLGTPIVMDSSVEEVFFFFFTKTPLRLLVGKMALQTHSSKSSLHSLPDSEKAQVSHTLTEISPV